MRKPIITVLGHVDSGKTRFLDAVRGTAVIDREAGGITQHIGATEIPIHVIKKISGDLLQKYGFNLSIPGLLFIDTPGHEAFTNLRERGSSIADLAVVVIDVKKGFEEQTKEAVEILKSFKVPFIVVANKVDTMFDWTPSPNESISSSLKKQNKEAIEKLDEKIYTIVGQLHEYGFSSERFDRVEEITKQIPIIPISAKTKEGFPEVLMFLSGLSQKYLEKQLNIKVSGVGKGTILEVKEERGLGKTIDIILYEGTIKTGNEIAVIGKNGVIITKVRALLQPKELDEMRDPEKRFASVKEVSAAAGVKVVAPNLSDALSGSPMCVVENDEDIEKLKKEIKNIKIERDVVGPVLKTDTFGALEALERMLEKSELKVSYGDVGDLSKREIIDIENIAKKDKYKGVVFLFNVKVSNELREELKNKNIPLFEGAVIYKLVEDYEKWFKEEKEKEKQEKLKAITYPAKIKILPNTVFRNSKPVIVGVRIQSGKLKKGVIVIKKDGQKVGKINAIQNSGKSVEEAVQNDEVAVSISDAIFGRTVNKNDELYSYLSSEDIRKIKTLGKEIFSDEELELVEKIREISKKVKE